MFGEAYALCVCVREIERKGQRVYVCVSVCVRTTDGSYNVLEA